MHIILLIWKNSKHYNVPSRLVVLIREICNALINQACNFVSGKQIFSLIESEAAGEVRACVGLRMCVRVLLFVAFVCA
jgi:dynein heavy chain